MIDHEMLPKRYEDAERNGYSVDPETGMIFHGSFSDTFGIEKKQLFLAALERNNLGVYASCADVNTHADTVKKHLQIDRVFRKLYDDVQSKYADTLENVSRSNALLPKNTLERIFQLKYWFPRKYSDNQRSAPQIVLNIDIESAKRAITVVDAKVVDNQHNPMSHNVTVDNNTMPVHQNI